jgi:hypothetical protein
MKKTIAMLTLMTFVILTIFFNSCKKEFISDDLSIEEGEFTNVENTQKISMKFFPTWEEQKKELQKQLRKDLSLKDSIKTIVFYVANFGDGGGIPGDGGPNYVDWNYYHNKTTAERHGLAWRDETPILCGGFSDYFMDVCYDLDLPWQVFTYNYGNSEPNSFLTHVSNLIQTPTGLYSADAMFGHVITNRKGELVDFFDIIKNLKKREEFNLIREQISFERDAIGGNDTMFYITNGIVPLIFEIMGIDDWRNRPFFYKTNSSLYTWKIKTFQTMDIWAYKLPREDFGGGPYVKYLNSSGFPPKIDYLTLLPIDLNTRNQMIADSLFLKIQEKIIE